MKSVTKNRLLFLINIYSLSFSFMSAALIFSIVFFPNFVSLIAGGVLIIFLLKVKYFKKRIKSIKTFEDNTKSLEQDILNNLKRIPNISIEHVYVTNVSSDLVACVEYTTINKSSDFLKSYQSSMDGLIKTEHPGIRNIFFKLV